MYCKEVVLQNGDLTMKLLRFAVEHKDYDLRDKCMEFLKLHVNSANIFQLYDVVCELRLPRFKNIFDKCLKEHIKVDNIYRVIKYLLECQEIDPHDLIAMKAKALRVVLENFRTIWENDSENFGLYEDFLLKNLEIDTVPLFAKYVYSHSREMTEEFQDISNGKWTTEISKGPLDVRSALFDFCGKNFKEIQHRGIVKYLPKMFLADLVTNALVSN